MIFVILAIWFGYKKGRDTGRNRFLWAAISAAAFIGGEVLGGLIIGGSIGLYEGLLDRDVSGETKAMALRFLPLIQAFITMGLVFRHLDKVPVEEEYSEPPPPTFNSAE